MKRVILLIISAICAVLMIGGMIGYTYEDSIEDVPVPVSGTAVGFANEPLTESAIPSALISPELTITWDADVSMECTLNGTVTAHIYENGTLIANSSLDFETYYQAWDYMYLNFTAPSGKESFGELQTVIQLRQWLSEPAIVWEEVEIWN